MDIQQLINIGGSEWKKNEKHRVYFNDLERWYGLRTSRYNTGNICSASLDGKGISNSAAKRIMGRIGAAKLFYDVPTQKFIGQGFSQEYDDFEECVKAIRAAVEKLGEAINA